MIAPNMATMLAYIATDANVAPNVLQKAFSDATAKTFNAMTVDGDTSTNDTALAMASGAAGNRKIDRATGPAYRGLRAALMQVCDDLAWQVAADGEGATHTIAVYVGGTRTDDEANRVAKTIAESPLVKTAIAGGDPNWGRIVAAAGRAGVAFDPADTSLTVSGVELFRGGTPTKFNVKKITTALQQRDVSIVLMVGNGPGRAKYYTCDLTHGYITINADYHT
jgi:glutamate N-acetyltransferase/amino-acid N-acetyltransferase